MAEEHSPSMAKQTPPLNPNPKQIKSITPVHLQVPKQSEFPERYMSPTDMIISPVSKGLLARNQKKGIGSSHGIKTSMVSALKP
ncbi:hypothetical protein IHE45_19G010500 [Dioscorea alata]|uniref:Uncharacterized protein n=1 Tax=Dioscorea alata TaxID=55571 RepID=A0ACB7TWB6_DIOAL|nr:hypothetical protein IHE45_19G010500 [Dioscorea alata]